MKKRIVLLMALFCFVSPVMLISAEVPADTGIDMALIAESNDIIFSDDGIYFVSVPKTYTDGIDAAIEFYKNDVLIRKYIIRDLIEEEYDNQELIWESKDKRRFDGENNILYITTVDETVYEFNITTGDAISITPKRNMPFGPMIVIMIAIIGLMFISRIRPRNV